MDSGIYTRLACLTNLRDGSSALIRIFLTTDHMPAQGHASSFTGFCVLRLEQLFGKTRYAYQYGTASLFTVSAALPNHLRETSSRQVEVRWRIGPLTQSRYLSRSNLADAEEVSMRQSRILMKLVKGKSHHVEITDIT